MANKSIDLILGAVKSAGEAALRLYEENESLRSRLAGMEDLYVQACEQRDDAVALLREARDDVVEASNHTHKPHAIAYYKDQLARIDAFLAGMETK